MKKIFAALLSASFLLSPIVASEASANDYRRPGVVERDVHKQVIVKKYRWTKGHRVSAAERRRMSDVRDYRRYRLSAPPRGYHWVKVDNDFLLVGVASGIISSIISGR
ncbi:RcnB family protein [Rhizobium sp. BE258]|jgi:Ni/Co efflux regulator RcnB|uniref:RcnB family protein n=1 Tax=unclassified Rhizobium TaxID=2613769 RepID=UPI000DD58026|nr:RcnB family protein [Rhizobium sp. BE258]MDR7144680.1 Ni/Co efflux regulator RcnB [Rhizobium sp. BE258]